MRTQSWDQVNLRYLGQDGEAAQRLDGGGGSDCESEDLWVPLSYLCGGSWEVHVGPLRTQTVDLSTRGKTETQSSAFHDLALIRPPA